MSVQKPFKRTVSDESTIVRIGSDDHIESLFFASKVTESARGLLESSENDYVEFGE